MTAGKEPPNGLAGFVEMVKGVVTGVEIDKDDDWAPMFFVSHPERTMIALIEGEFLDNPFNKDVLAELIMPKCLRDYSATRWSFFSCAWTLEVERDDSEEVGEQKRRAMNMGSIANHPDRKEVVQVVTGDAEGTVIMTCGAIDRSGDHPVVHEWHLWDESLWTDAYNDQKGRFVDANMRAVMGLPSIGTPSLALALAMRSPTIAEAVLKMTLRRVGRSPRAFEEAFAADDWDSIREIAEELKEWREDMEPHEWDMAVAELVDTVLQTMSDNMLVPIERLDTASQAGV